MAAYMIFAAKLFGKTADDIKRVKPGDIEFVSPRTWWSLYDMYSAVEIFGREPGLFSGSTWTFVTMIWCTMWAYDWDKHEIMNTPGFDHLYCYDNILADLTLGGGKGGISGINKYIDVYTWEGLGEVYAFGIVHALIVEWSWNTILGIAMGILFAVMAEELPLCRPNEQEIALDIFGNKIDLCTLLDW